MAVDGEGRGRGAVNVRQGVAPVSARDDHLTPEGLINTCAREVAATSAARLANPPERSIAMTTSTPPASDMRAGVRSRHPQA